MPQPAPRTTAAAAPARPRRRVQWVDAAKGLCIVLVVIGHAITELADHGYATGIWAQVNFILGPVRMPLFFLASGLFAAKALSEPWSRLADRRIWVMVWLYVIWVPVRELFHALIPRTRVDEPGILAAPEIADPLGWPRLAARMAHAVVEPTSYLWFLYALAMFAVASKATAKVHPGIQIAAAAALNVLAPFAPVSWSWNFMTQMYVFYLIGMYAAPRIFAMVARRNPLVPAAAVALYAAGAGWILATHDTFNEGNTGPLRFALSLAGVTAAVNLIAMAEGTPLIEPFRRLGARTLPVFLMHIPLMAAIVFVANLVLPADPGLPGQPVLLALAGIAACLGVHRLLMAHGGRWLFARPERLRHAR